MHDIEPYYNWRNFYIADEDPNSPFHGKLYNEFEFTDAIYNFYIHPQWDNFGSPTMYLKILFANYDDGYVIIELIGEWNDAINNDIMYLKRDLLESLLGNGINKFILIGENLLNFHGSDDCYYEEWFEEVEDGWIAFVNFREHVLEEMKEVNIDNYVILGGTINEVNWRTFTPKNFFLKVEQYVTKRLTM